MLGLRGVRLGLVVPGLVAMQVRAVAEAVVARKRAGGDPRAEIMVPLVDAVEELHLVREEVDAVLAEVADETGVRVDCPVGTMIELPRAALTAGRIAEEAQFFSFGTNDLTQTTWGFSRDDVEAAFFSAYLDKGIFRGPRSRRSTAKAWADWWRSRSREGRGDPAGPQDRRLRGTRRRPCFRALLPRRRTGLRLLLARSGSPSPAWKPGGQHCRRPPPTGANRRVAVSGAALPARRPAALANAGEGVFQPPGRHACRAARSRDLGTHLRRISSRGTPATG